ncbi:MAG: DUF935 family protein [Patescibacteria group bacterium]|nr:DUF935 family protein [Patescibacteria group bacterium]
MNTDGISQFNQARIEWAIRLRYSPMPELDMKWLASNLNAFRIGEMRVVGKIWEIMMERDGELAVNADKRYSDASGLEWQVVSDGSPDGDKHAESLRYFYNNLKATEALDQDDTGKCDHLIYQTMSALSYRYSAHEMLLRIDNPAAKEITAEFRHTPIWFFESRRGYLAYLQHIFDLYGQPCIQGEWLTAVNIGWMRPLSMAFAMKHFPLRDWLIFCTRYGTGFLEGETDAQMNSPEWEQASQALETLANDGVVLHNRGVTFKFLDQPSKNALPFQPIVEMINGLYSKCYRGVELATGSRMSAGGEGAGGGGGARNPAGASVMNEESGIFLVRDAKWITGVFNERIDRPIIRYLYGQEPRAWFALMPPMEDTSDDDLNSLKTLVPMGLRVALDEVYKRFHWKQPSADEPTLNAPQPPPSPFGAPPTPREPSGAPGADALDGKENPDAQEPKPEQEGGAKPPQLSPPPKPQPPLAEAQPAAAAPAGPKPEAQHDTISAREDENTPIAPGADPKRRVQTADEAMPTPQVDAGGFWSRVGLAPRGADGKTLPMPSLGYAIPNAADIAARREFAAAVAHDLSPLLERLGKIITISDDKLFEKKLQQLKVDFDKLSKDIQADPGAQQVLKQIITQGMLRGLTDKSS